MGGGATVVTESSRLGEVRADRAVFTSIRSPMGEGYRLVAASPGISVEERREITQRSPSHGSLCDASLAGRGLASYRLSSGRHCIASSRYAGLEHTARGGGRVYTTIVVLDRSAFERFGFDPLAVQAALDGNGNDDVSLKLPEHLSPHSLMPEPPGETQANFTSSSDVMPALDRLIHILTVMLCESPLIVAGVPEPWMVLRMLLSGLPRARREMLSVSLGLKWSAARPFQLVLMQMPISEARRLLHDRDAALEDWSSPRLPNLSAYGAWLSFVRRRWEAGRAAELHALTGGLAGEVSPGSLERVAEAIERAEQNDAAKTSRSIEDPPDQGASEHAPALRDSL